MNRALQDIAVLLNYLNELPDSPDRGGTGAAAFVDWTRDFLAAVAAPATASSIRLTRQDAIYRSRGLLGWLGRPLAWVFRTVSGPSGGGRFRRP